MKNIHIQTQPDNMVQMINEKKREKMKQNTAEATKKKLLFCLYIYRWLLLVKKTRNKTRNDFHFSTNICDNSF